MDKSSNSLLPMLPNSGYSVVEFKQATRLSIKCCQIASTAAL